MVAKMARVVRVSRVKNLGKVARVTNVVARVSRVAKVGRVAEEARVVKAGTHEGACSRSTLLHHAPGAKLPRLHQRFVAKKYVAQQNFCSQVLLPHIKLV